MWTDEDIAEILLPYVINDDRSLLYLLTGNLVQEKYRVPPKSKILYRGTQLFNIDSFQVPKMKSYTSSLSTAKEFAIGLMGNDIKQSKNKKIPAVFKLKVNPEDILISIGSFIRKAKHNDKILSKFTHENEYILNKPYLIDKKQIIWTSNKVFYY